MRRRCARGLRTTAEVPLEMEGVGAVPSAAPAPAQLVGTGKHKGAKVAPEPCPADAELVTTYAVAESEQLRPQPAVATVPQIVAVKPDSGPAPAANGERLAAEGLRLVPAVPSAPSFMARAAGHNMRRFQGAAKKVVTANNFVKASTFTDVVVRAYRGPLAVNLSWASNIFLTAAKCAPSRPVFFAPRPPGAATPPCLLTSRGSQTGRVYLEWLKIRAG